MSYDEIREMAMELPEKERGALAEELIESLGPDEGEEIDPELMAIIERRVAEIDAGTAKLIPVEESIARARAALEDARRNSRRG
jgi:putative addiction module component (TIGR02574 family)